MVNLNNQTIGTDHMMISYLVWKIEGPLWCIGKCFHSKALAAVKIALTQCQAQDANPGGVTVT